MKKLLAFICIAAISFIFTGCTYWTFSDHSNPSSEKNITSSDYVFTKDIHDFKEVELILDVDVSDISFVTASNDEFSLTQITNHKELFVIPTITEKGDLITLQFDSPKSLKLFVNSNSSIVIKLPKNISYTVSSTVDVGNFKLMDTENAFDQIHAKTNVGNVEISISADQKQLEQIELSSDVGNLSLSLDGNYSELEAVTMDSDTGNVSCKLNGKYDQNIDLITSTDVGDVALELTGAFSNDNHAKINTSVGALDVLLNENNSYKIDADSDDVVSDVSYNGISTVVIDDSIYINTTDSDDYDFYLETSCGIGDAHFSY